MSRYSIPAERYVEPYELPTAHSEASGTGAKVLAEEYQAAHQALNRACEALAAATCDARDFHSDGAWKQAQLDRADMFSKLAELQHYSASWMYRACSAPTCGPLTSVSTAG
jgi:hypothetical protein